MKILYKTLSIVFALSCCLPAFAQLPRLDWHRSIVFPDNGALVAFQGVRTALDGSIYVSATFNAAVDLDPGPGTAILDPKNGTSFFAKYDQRGNLLWLRQTLHGGTIWNINPETGWLAYHSSFDVSYDFDPGPGTHILTAAANSSALVRLDANGNFRGARDLRLTAWPNELALTNDGRIIVVGQIGQATNFDPQGSMILSPAGSADGFVALYDTGLNIRHAFAVGGPSTDAVNTIGLTSEGFMIGGYGREEANFHPAGGTHNIPLGTIGGFLASYRIDPSGLELKKLVHIGSVVEQISTDPATAELNILGTLADSMDADPGSGKTMLHAIGRRDQFISHTRADGSFGFARLIHLPQLRPYATITPSAQGGLLYGGTAHHPLSLDSGRTGSMITPSDDGDLFLGKFADDGTLRYSLHMAAQGGGTSARTTIATNGAIIAAGLTRGVLDLDPGAGTTAINPTSEVAIFLARYKDENTLGIDAPVRYEAVRIHGTGRAAIIDFTGCCSVDASIAVNDISGRVMLRATHQNLGTRRLDLAQLPAGMYIVTVLNGGDRITKRILVHD